MEFPVSSVKLIFTKRRSDVVDIKRYNFSRSHFKIDEDDFLLDLNGIACYRIQKGCRILIYPYDESDSSSVKIFLLGSILGVVLHQKGILPFHGSSFSYKEKGIIICGHSGAGKSSVTAAFCQKAATLINDDITPVCVATSKTTIIPLNTHIKLWDDSLKRLQINQDELERIRPNMDKFYLPWEKSHSSEQALNHLFILSTHQKNDFIARDLDGIEKYNALRSQIYRRIYLKGMPETEKKYFKQLFSLATNVRVTNIFRPKLCDIYETKQFIEKIING